MINVGKSFQIGIVCYLGIVQGYEGVWVGVEWDIDEGCYDGFVNGVCYFEMKFLFLGFFVWL